FWEHYGSHLAWQHRKVLDAIVRCRTAALGGHRDQCVRCGHQAISYNSCRNRHCPRCQGNARSRWLAERRAELLPVSYFHIVFTLPHELSALILQNKRLLYDLLFRASAETLLELARDPKHLGAEIGFLGVLHTWGQNLQHHPHIHYVVPAGGLPPHRRAQPRLSRQVHRRTQATFSAEQAPIPRFTSDARRATQFPWSSPAAFPRELGRLRQ